eukprot:scaffold40846_cov55-Phaeocystis_antarctica.AAC.1
MLSAGSASAGGMPKSASHSPKSSLDSAMTDVKSSYNACSLYGCSRRSTSSPARSISRCVDTKAPKAMSSASSGCADNCWRIAQSKDVGSAGLPPPAGNTQPEWLPDNFGGLLSCLGALRPDMVA